MSLDMLAYMKNQLEAHPFDVPTPSCDPHSGLLTIFHSGPILAKMSISEFRMNSILLVKITQARSNPTADQGTSLHPFTKFDQVNFTNIVAMQCAQNPSGQTVKPL